MAWRHSEFGFGRDYDGIWHWLNYAPIRPAQQLENALCGARIYAMFIKDPQEGWPTCLRCARLRP